MSDQTILYVENDAAVRSVTARALRRLGYDVIEVEDVASATAAELNHPGAIGLVVSEVALPDGSGVDLIADILRRRPDVRSLFVTAYSPDSAQTPRRLNAMHVLEKPFTLQDLTTRVRAALSRLP